MLPDSETLQRLIDAATPGDWGIGNHGTHEVQAGGVLIADCGTIDRAEADARLMSRAKVLAAEVLRLRAELAEYRTENRALVATREQLRGEVTALEEESAHNQEVVRLLQEDNVKLNLRIGGLKDERDAARKEAEELRALNAELVNE